MSEQVIRAVGAAGIAVTALCLLVSLRHAGREVPIRRGLELARVILGAAGVVVIGMIGSVTTPLVLAGLAVVAGIAVGFAQGKTTEVRLVEGTAVARRTLAGIAVWFLSLVAMQAAGVLNRTGVFRVGQALALFGIAVTVGVMLGRRNPARSVDGRRTGRLATAAGVMIVIAGTAIAMSGSLTPRTFAQGDEEPEIISVAFTGSIEEPGGSLTVEWEAVLEDDVGSGRGTVVIFGPCTTGEDGQPTDNVIEADITATYGFDLSADHVDGTITVAASGFSLDGYTGQNEGCREAFVILSNELIPVIGGSADLISGPATFGSVPGILSVDTDGVVAPTAADERPQPDASQSQASEEVEFLDELSEDEGFLDALTEGEISTDDALAMSIAAVLVAVAMGVLSLVEAQVLFQTASEMAQKSPNRAATFLLNEVTRRRSTTFDPLPTDASKLPNAIHGDRNSDGEIDTTYADRNRDGSVDTILHDDDGDGKTDRGQFDTNEDGLFDGIGVDTNDDGQIDTVHIDDDGDGGVDRVARDLDRDGVTDQIEFDDDGDGVPERSTVDRDQDGVPDRTEFDNDGDGMPERVEIDEDEDGTIDTIITPRDEDGDGVVDGISVDTDADGIPDQHHPLPGQDDAPVTGADEAAEAGDARSTPGASRSVERDLDGDGAPDATGVMTDTDGDGFYDHGSVDLGNDGTIDHEGPIDLIPVEEPATTDGPVEDADAAADADDVVAEEMATEEGPVETDPPGGIQLSDREIADRVRWGVEHNVPVDEIQADLDGLNRARGGDGTIPLPEELRTIHDPDLGTITAPSDDIYAFREAQVDLRYLRDHDDDLRERWNDLQTRRNKYRGLEEANVLRGAAAMQETFEVWDSYGERIEAVDEEIRRIHRAGRLGQGATEADYHAFRHREFYEANRHRLPQLREQVDNLESERLARLQAMSPDNTTELEGSSMANRPRIMLDKLDQEQDELMAEFRAIKDKEQQLQHQIDGFLRAQGKTPP